MLTHSSQVQRERPLNICALKSDRTDAEKRGEGDSQHQRRKSRGCNHTSCFFLIITAEEVSHRVDGAGGYGS